ncbi:hypothetical protein [Corynebacterium meridianum]|uniref:Tetratricopeptide repeat protein n=1 Tax=Corynebacterium meridianum TaxID=2765363 RepID=A0A934M4V3_9CORY|nr:hypothetical protein [Corynebacterium meridianum]MBI8989451.1 hypothetical protein [Corynebacterium meridianum]
MTESDNQHDELRLLMHRADSTPWGSTCSELWAEAAQLAVDTDRLEEALICHAELCTAYCMDGRNYRCIAPFSYVEEMRSRRPDLFSPGLHHKHAWNLKYVLSAVANNPDVPVAQYRSLLDLMTDYYRELGDPGRAVAMRRLGFLRNTGGDGVEDTYAEWLGLPDSELADCAGCGPEQRVEYHASRGEWEIAREIGEAALPDMENSCSSQPEGLLTEMLEPWLRTGQDARAWAAHVRGYRRYRRDPADLAQHADHIRYLALSGAAGRPERLERAEAILIRHLPWWERAEDHRDLLNLAAAAVVLLDRIPGATDRTLDVTLPGESLPWVTGIETLAHPTLAEARAWFLNLATTIAEQFDARPGMEHAVHVASLHRLIEPEPVTPLPEPTEGTVADVSGMFTPDEADYQVITSPGASTGPATETTTAPDPGEDEPPVVPIDVTGWWRGDDLAEALAANAAVGDEIETVHWHHAVHLLLDHPGLRTSPEAAGVPDELRGAWQRAVGDAEWFLGVDLDAETEELPGTTGDPAYRLIEEAAAALRSGQVMEACQAADTAMRTGSAEPVGVRLTALLFLARGARDAGYLDEGIDCARQMLNLCAAAELPGLTFIAAQTLGELLISAHRYHEAAEVLETALMKISGYPGSRAELDLRESLVRVFAKLEFHDEAGEELLKIAGHMARRMDRDRELGALQQAAVAFDHAGESRRAVSTWHRIIEVSRSMWREAADRLAAGDGSEGQLREKVDRYREAYALALYKCCAAAVNQPGYVGDADMAVVDDLLDTLRVLVNDPEHPGPKTPEWREADWLVDKAYMYLYAMRFLAAVDYATAAASGFEQLHEPVDRARALMMASDARFYGDEPEASVEAAREALGVLAGKRFIGHPVRRAAEQRIREVGDH